MIDPIIRRQIYLTQFANGEARKSAENVLELAKELTALVKQGVANDIQISQLSALEAEITKTVSKAVDKLRADIADTIDALAPIEAAKTIEMLDGVALATFSAPSIEQVITTVTNAEMTLVSGKVIRVHTIESMIDEFDAATAGDVTHMVRYGVVSGTSTQDIAKDVGALVTTRSQSQAEAVVRTAVAHIANIARQEVYRENSDILEGEEWVATLDGRTRPEHAALDGKIFPIGEGPQPPYGWNCRCARVPVVKKGLLPEKDDYDRASIDGPVSGKDTYNTWLKRQPESFQNDVLGKKRADLFRDGADLDKFINDKGMLLTLEELKKK